ncbi:MAG: peptidase [Bacilli bacterium]|nr:peptidase [Bacilli bacterium]
MKGGNTLFYIQWYLISSLIIIAFWIDIRSRKIPNWLTVSGITSGVLYHLLSGGVDGILFSVYGLFLGFALLFIVYLMGALGAGDVKLFAAIGAITGTEFTLDSMIYAMIYAGIIGCFILLSRQQFVRKISAIFKLFYLFAIIKEVAIFTKLDKKQMIRFPFMWAVLPAVITCGMNWKGI